MSKALVTAYRKSANGRIEAIELTVDEAEHVVARWPFAWSLDRKTFAPWPWPEHARGMNADPPNWSPPQCA